MRVAHQLGTGLKLLVAARLTLAMVLAWVAFEVWKVTTVSDPMAHYLQLGLSRQEVKPAMPWQLLSYALVHGSWLHLVMNSVLLVSAASHLEWILGRCKCGMVILGGVVVGGLLHLVLSSNILVGGSGAVFAVMLCLMTLSPESRWRMPFSISAKNFGRGLVIASIILILIHPEKGILGLSQLGQVIVNAGLGGVFRISHACHLGGAVAGWLVARWVLRRRVTLESLQRDRARREGS